MRKPNSTRETITITDALDCGMTQTDRDLAETIVVMAGAVSAYHLHSGKYAGFVNADGAVVAYLPTSLTYITVTPRAAHIPTYLPGEATPASIEDGGYDVYLAPWKKVQERLAGYEIIGTPTEAKPVFCGTCFVAVPVKTGVCETCNEV